MIPLVHDFTGETVLIFGGGPVGARKARRFDREADVVVVSPEFADVEFSGARLVHEAPDAEDATSWIDRTTPALVVAATNDADLNAAITETARDHGALVNRADESGERDVGSVVVPATIRDDPVTVALSTGGTSPALSKYLREQFEAEFPDSGEMARLTADLRETLKSEGVPPAERRDAVRTVVRSDRVWKALDRGRSNVRHVATDVIDEHTGDLS